LQQNLSKQPINILSWQDIEYRIQDLKNIFDKYKLNKKITKLYAVPLGGIIPGILLKKKISLAIEFKVLEEEDSSRETVLIIDDIVDTGKTFTRIFNSFPNAYFFSLYAKEGFNKIKRLIGNKYETANIFPNRWHVFPWEDKDEGKI